jgi:microcystin-dependent protein
MTYADTFNIRTKNVKFNDVADAIDGTLTRGYGGTTTGTSTAYIASPSPAWAAYDTSIAITIIPHVTNAAGSPSVTLNVSGLGAKALKKNGVDIGAGFLLAGSPVLLIYTGTYFEVIIAEAVSPIGTIVSYAFSTAPTGWLLCDGQPVSRSTYANLHTLMANDGYPYGNGDGVNTFNVPDLRRRTAVGTGSSDTLGASDAVSYSSRTLTHTHSVPAHYHGMGTGANLNITSSGSGTTGNDSPDHSHNIGFSTSPNIYAWTVSATATAGWTLASATTSSGASVRHTHTTPNHTHGSASFAGNIGLVTGGVNGNAAMTSGVSSQPHLFVNYIIKH